MLIRSKIKLNSRGYNILELIISMAISAILMGIVSYALIHSFSRSSNEMASSMLKTESDTLFKIIHQNLENSFRLTPNEDLYSVNDKTFQGVNGLNQAVSNCKYGAIGSASEFSILRTIKVLPNSLPERLLRAWNEDSIANPTPLSDFRISYMMGKGRMFQTANNPKEILLIDIDGFLRSRFKVISSNLVNTNKDPFDDLPKMDTLGNPINFEYSQLTLGKPLNVLAQSQTVNNIWYITNSIVYPSNTEIVCVSNEGSVILINETLGSQRQLLNPSLEGYSIEKFAIKYFATSDVAKYAPALATDFEADIEKAKCTNIVNIEIILTPIGNVKNKRKIRFLKTFFINNFNYRRPDLCKN